ncbi:hypothetical protein [Streptomyces sp. NPDC001536]|uniref:hypothetical protein n=1 Tax=Streptomyces sp. NPDC001536 TaxID=3364583 RepID=UPI00367D8391
MVDLQTRLPCRGRDACTGGGGGLTDNQEIIAGVKAFLRLLRTTDTADGAPAPG